MTLDNEKIGVLDSGVGGLSVLKELIKLMPDKDYLFLGDTKNMPYGTKTPEQLYSFTKKILDFFISKDVKNVVFACNTTSAVVYDKLNFEYGSKIKIFPLIQSAAKSAIEGLKDDDTICVFATRATVNSNKYFTEIAKINDKINVLNVDCTGFVEIVEKRLYNDPSSIDLIKEKLKIAKENCAKRIILGCTHYPYLVDIFKKIYDVEYFNPASALADVVKNSMKNTSKTGSIQFFATKSPKDFILSAKMFFDVEKVELVEL